MTLLFFYSKVVSVDHNKPIIVPAGQDSFSQIGEKSVVYFFTFWSLQYCRQCHYFVLSLKLHDVARKKENFKAILCTSGYILIRCFSLHLGSPPVSNQDMGKMHSR